MSDVFLSYSVEDRQVAREVARLLADEHVSVFHDETSLVAGELWADRVTKALMRAKVVIVLLSQNSRRSSWVEHELAHALQHGKLIIPVLMEPGAKDNWIWPLVADRQPVIVQDKSDMAKVVQAVVMQPELSKPSRFPAVPSGVTFRQLVGQMKVSQLFAALAALTTLIVGVGAGFYRLGAVSSDKSTVAGTAAVTASSNSGVTVVPGRTGDERPSLLGPFLGGRTQEFAGEGTIQPPICHMNNNVLKIEIAAPYRGFAGCYIDLPEKVNLVNFVNGFLRVELQYPARQFEIKLESAGPGDGRREAYIFKGQADAGGHRYVVRGLPEEIIRNANRLTFALANEPDKANTITVID